MNAAGPDPADILVEQIDPERWRDWREVRLRSLLEDPEAFGSTHAREEAFDEAVWRSRVDESSGPAVLAYAGTTPVAMGAGWLYEPGRLMVVAMWTDPLWRGHGLGRSVLHEVLAWAARHGLRPDLWVADSNPDARRLYERHGFRPDGRTAPLREDSPRTMSRLVLRDGIEPLQNGMGQDGMGQHGIEENGIDQ